MGKTERKNNKYSYEFKKEAVEQYLSAEQVNQIESYLVQGKQQ